MLRSPPGRYVEDDLRLTYVAITRATHERF